MTDPHPLRLRPVLFPKVWGGDRLARLGRAVAPGDRIGESWEVADLDSTSAGGAGGQAVRSVIDAGPLAGRTLRDAIAAWGSALTGPGGGSAFPLLVKYLDARENLSIQVHPSAEYARTHPGAHVKGECWYVLDADAGARIYKGVRPGVTRDRFERALRSGDGRGVLDLIESVPAIPGECHDLPSGTVHALGAGVLVAEVQTPSDTTFRVYDWGRTGRALHVEEALACIAWGPAPAATRAGPRGRTRLATTPYFTLDAWRLLPGERVDLTPDRPSVVMLLEGSGRVEFPGAPAIPVGSHDMLVVPAAPGSRLEASVPVLVLVASPC